MIHLSGLQVRDEANPAGEIEIRFTGLRPGEKLREELLGNGEITPTDHPMILRAMEAVIPWEELQRAIDTLAAACSAYEPEGISAVFRSLLEGFEPPPPAGDPLGTAAP